MIDSTIALEALVCFLAGSIPFAVIAMWGSGIDIRKVGSGNPGFNNVLRVNKPRALLTLAGDMLKGFVPLYFFWDSGLEPQWQGWLYAFGGKGIATSAGVMLRLFPMWALAGLAFFALLRLTGSRRKWREAGAVASVLTWVFFTAVLFLYEGQPAVRYSALMTVFLAWRHHSNIRRLIAG